MLGYIAAYVGGIATGAMLIYINKRSVNAALNAQKKRFDAEIKRRYSEIDRLKGDYSDLERSFEARDISRKARAEGVEQGRRMGGAERFASGFEASRQTVEFRDTGKTA